MKIMRTDILAGPSEQWRNGLLAGLAGGAAEVVWIAIYSGLTGVSASSVAGGVTATLMPAEAGTAMAVPIGLVIHFGLAAMLGLAVAVFLRNAVPQLAGSLAEVGLITTVLGAVWALNFLLVLPLINPDFVHVVPMSVSFISKILFGLAAATVLKVRVAKDARIVSQYSNKDTNYV